MKLANALMLPTGQGSPSKTRQGGAQELMALEQQDRKHKFPMKAIEEWHILHDKKMNDALSILGQMAKAQEGGKERSTQGKSGYFPPGNFRCGEQSSRTRKLEGVRPRQAAGITSSCPRIKATEKSIKESASDREENSDNEYRSMHIRHVLRNFDWDHWSRSLLKSMTRTNGNLRAFVEE
jgi:hypothetical protein